MATMRVGLRVIVFIYRTVSVPLQNLLYEMGDDGDGCRDTGVSVSNAGKIVF